ncbi:MAG TPA: nucleotidyltransferase domain-containing protein [Candidatus Paceibacterota bacterium]
MTSEQEWNIQECVSKMGEVKLLYLFGSQARGEQGPMSDYDFAVYLDEVSRDKMSNVQIDLINAFSKILETDKIDVLVLNKSDNSVLNYMAIAESKLLYETEPYLLIVEPRIVSEYIDYTEAMRRHGLTKA